jgi:transcriptional regulator
MSVRKQAIRILFINLLLPPR